MNEKLLRAHPLINRSLKEYPDAILVYAKDGERWRLTCPGCGATHLLTPWDWEEQTENAGYVIMQRMCISNSPEFQESMKDVYKKHGITRPTCNESATYFLIDGNRI